MKILCPAKINLFLNVIRKKENVHELVLINQTVDLYDEIECILTKENIITIKPNNKIPLDETNSIYQAAKLMKDTYQIETGMIFIVKKKIPLEAGLGGESTDAAGTILLINEIFHLNKSKEELSRLGIQIGSDVPYFIHSGYQKVASIGDVIRKPKKKNPFEYYIIIKPNFGCHTKEMFQKIDQLEFKKRNIKLSYNDFMKVVPDKILEIRDYCNQIGCKNHTLSGSGSSYYIALEKEDKKLFNKIKNHYKEYQVFLVKNCEGFIIKEEGE